MAKPLDDINGIFSIPYSKFRLIFHYCPLKMDGVKN